ncbi:Nicotinate phosphoribosyltransferase (NAPRTase) family [Musa troglodytarum]|uniref:nicotinate phosphoribosyltransferase n=1 Tax=Musa troglodytarum TaxID=320322 RepID=A0A9E7F6E8_9LILI|nr:Nicotinate phosphoribosyltransferase (NAPRTase) family [Musa troglodytarum]
MAALASGNGTIDAAATAEQRQTAEAAPIRSATNPMVTPLLTDLYQFTMAYAYWKAGKHLERAVFDLYFRKNPFGGEYTVFAGLEECIRLIANFHFKEEDISFMRSVMPTCEDGFFEYLREVDCSDVEVYAVPEGSVVFPKVPLIRVEGPVAVVQLLETPFVNLVNYASLVTTNAARHRFVAGNTKYLLEFGLRRAQSPDEIVDKSLHSHDGSSTCMDFLSLVQTWLSKLQLSESLHGVFGETNQSELAAFTSYALAFPNNFLALVDTYDVIRSGIPNFCAVALALNDLGYKASGIRLDSGDLAYLSIEARKFFQAIEKEFNVPGFGKMSITASNDLNEETLDALNKQGHEIDAFGIGTYLVTCYTQAALGCVFKLVEINKQPRIKLSEDVTKVSIPCKKRCFRLYGREGYALVDIMTGENETPPKVGERILCRHPFNESKRAYVVPQRVEELLKCYWPGSSNKPREDLPVLKIIRDRCMQQLEQMRSDHMRRLNPTPYKVSVSGKLYDFIHFLWLSEAPVGKRLISTNPIKIIPKKNRHEICKYLFQEGVLFAKKDYNLAKHPEIEVPNLQVIKLMQSFKSREYVRETFAWQHYYWYLTNDGIEYLRTYLNLPSEIVPATLKKSSRPPPRPFGSGPPGDRPRGPPRFEGDRPRFGDRDGYRGGPRGGPPGDFGGDKGGAPPEFQPSFRVQLYHEETLVRWAMSVWVLKVGLALAVVVVVMEQVQHRQWSRSSNGKRSRKAADKKKAVVADMPSHEMDVKTDSEVTSNATSSPARPVYYVQSPSRDSHDGEKTTTTTTSFNSSPALSPPRSHSSVGRHSRESSSSRFSGSLKPAGARKISPHDGGGRGSRRRGCKTWKECSVIEEEGLLDGEEDDAGVPRRCYFLGFVLAFFVLFSFFALILWGASRNQRPRIIMKSITFDNFIIQAGTDASLVPTDMATLNSTLKFTYRNTGSFFGVHVTSTPIDLNYYQLTLASGNMNNFYQSRKSKRELRVAVKGHQVPLYGGGSSLSSSEGKTSGPVGMTLSFTARSRAYVLGKLVKPKFYSNVQCSVTMDQTKLGTPVSLKNSCRYS